MDLDPSLAYTAIIEMRPGLDAATVSTLTAQLADAMSDDNPGDRWAFARGWLDGRERQFISRTGQTWAAYAAHHMYDPPGAEREPC